MARPKLKRNLSSRRPVFGMTRILFLYQYYHSLATIVSLMRCKATMRMMAKQHIMLIGRFLLPPMVTSLTLMELLSPILIKLWSVFSRWYPN